MKMLSKELFQCQNCLRKWKVEQLKEIADIFERVGVGERMPAGECPTCGALCHAAEVNPKHPKRDAKGKRVKTELTLSELELLVEALDSHGYWQLSEPQYRRDGFVQEPGTNDPDNKKELAFTDALHDRLEKTVSDLRAATRRPK
jgi:hypothetical protein